MEWVEEEGKTKTEALEKALNRIGLPEEKIKVEVVQENKKKFGLIGSNYIRVKVHYDPLDQALIQARSIIEEMLDKMGIDFVVEGAQQNGSIFLNIISPQSALIIGKRGQTIDALQYLMNRMLSKKMGQRLSIVLDTENYRQKHAAKLEEMARQSADRVRSTGKPVFMPPMNPHDRRIVHMALQDDKDVYTDSRGEGFMRKIRISLRSFRKEDDR
jgi:spoIIIJ-associated protein